MEPSSPSAKAREYIDAKWPNKGPCLIARDGANVPNCHENDFCECEMQAAFLAGHTAGRAEAEALAVALKTLRNEVRGTLHAHEVAIRYDSGNSNWACLELALERAERELAAWRGGNK